MHSGDDISNESTDSIPVSDTAPARSGGAKAQSKDRDMGAALRTIYQQTIEEAVPQDLLDLLGKLD